MLPSPAYRPEGMLHGEGVLHGDGRWHGEGVLHEDGMWHGEGMLHCEGMWHGEGMWWHALVTMQPYMHTGRGAKHACFLTAILIFIA